MTTIDGRCFCKRCEDRTGDIYRMVGACANCHTDHLLMIFRTGDRATALDCPVCGRDGSVLPERLATADEIPVS